MFVNRAPLSLTLFSPTGYERDSSAKRNALFKLEQQKSETQTANHVMASLQVWQIYFYKVEVKSAEFFKYYFKSSFWTTTIIANVIDGPYLFLWI